MFNFLRGSKRPVLTSASTEYGHVVLNESRGQYWHLNDSALQILQSLRDGGDRKTAADRLVSRYGLSPESARHDVDVACKELEEVGLL